MLFLLTAQSADLLRCLLDIEVDAADGHNYRAGSISVQIPETGMTQLDEDEKSIFRMYNPYYGIVRIAQNGVILKVMPTARETLEARNSR